jgi:hypothetical protein
LQVGSHFKQPIHPIWVVASESHYSILFALTASVQAVDALSALEERLLAAFSEFDQVICARPSLSSPEYESDTTTPVSPVTALASDYRRSLLIRVALQEGNGFISSEHLPTVLASLPQWQTPPADEVRAKMDPDSTSLIIWDAFQRVMMPLHPRVAELQQAGNDTHAAPSSIELYHYNGLGAAGHAHKRALKRLDVQPGARPVGPAPQGLAAIIATRWKDALVSHEGAPPSIN